MENLESEVRKLKKQVGELLSNCDELRKDLDKLIVSHCKHCENTESIARTVRDFLVDYDRQHERIWERLNPTFAATFPKHNRYLDEIDRALARAQKQQRRGLPKR